jgi:predicted AAA+ superfamily ATPase
MSSTDTCFLWGPRQTGKTTLLRQLFPSATRYDLLLADEYRRLVQDPTLIRQECRARGLDGSTQTDPIIIDEIQKIPALLDEVHWLIENVGLRFILCGSSARKLRRHHGNLLGGRAVRYELFPFVSAELDDFDLDRALNHGLVPRHYLAKSPRPLLEAYAGDYLREEITAEALTRNVPAFSRFLEVAALTNGELVSYSNIARECGVSSPTIKQYYQILEDTLIGFQLPSFRRRAKRRVVAAPRFYFFDVGVVAQLARRGVVRPGSELFGRAFEHFLVTEVRAHASYSGSHYPLAYWRTVSQIEVDCVLGDGEVAIEIKSTEKADDRHFKGLREFRREFPGGRCILVSRDPRPRVSDDGIEVLPWTMFLESLWAGELAPRSR